MSNLVEIGKKYARKRYHIAVEYEKRDKKGVVRRTRVMSRYSALEAQHALDGFLASLEPEVTVLGTSIALVRIGNEKPFPQQRWGEAAQEGSV